MKIRRNILISIIALLVAAVLYLPFMAICVPLFGVEDHDPSFAICLTVYACLASLVVYFSGFFFIKPSGRMKFDILSIGMLGMILFLIYIVLSVSSSYFWRENAIDSFISTHEMKYIVQILMDTLLYLIGCFVPSFLLWLGMFSRKENRILVKKAFADAKQNKG